MYKLDLQASGEKVWEEVGSMNVGRGNKFGVKLHDGKFFVFGGHLIDGGALTDTIEEYDIATDTWNLLPETMGLETESLSVKVEMNMAWIYVWVTKELREFDLAAKMFTGNALPQIPLRKCVPKQQVVRCLL